ncbi:MAG: hypothetical protein JWO89_2979 [Verrucomicrobiaceae bacterium]|nr:hypothetical protein [Verrucomicrobiaceae bacterium]
MPRAAVIFITMKASFLSRSLAAALLLPSCSLFHPPETVLKAGAPVPGPVKDAPLFEWNGSEATGPARVTIDLGEQKARIYKGGQQVGWTYVATGVDGRRTPSGNFSITEKIADKRSNLWGVMVDAEGDTVNSNARNGVSPVPEGGHFVGARMPHWMRLTGGGIGMHGGPIPRPGHTASHGCIRLPYAMATHMYEALPTGTPVSIVD